MHKNTLLSLLTLHISLKRNLKLNHVWYLVYLHTDTQSQQLTIIWTILCTCSMSHIAHAYMHADTNTQNLDNQHLKPSLNALRLDLTFFVLSHPACFFPPSGGPGCHSTRWGRERSPLQSFHQVCVFGQLAYAPRGADWPQHAWALGAGQAHQHQPCTRSGCGAATPTLHEVSCWRFYLACFFKKVHASEFTLLMTAGGLNRSFIVIIR